MREKLRSLGMNVHDETIAVAVAEPDGEVAAWVRLPTRRVAP
jgi:transposase